MNIIVLVAFAGLTTAQSLIEPLIFLHDRFTKKIDTNYLFPQLWAPEDKVCTSATGIYCSLLNQASPHSSTVQEINIKQTLQKSMLEIIQGMESKRMIKTFHNYVHLYEQGMRHIVDDKLFYEKLENLNPVKFFFDFNNYILKNEQQPIDKNYILNADERLIYLLDEAGTLSVKSSEVVCTIKNLFLPSLEDIQRYTTFSKKFTEQKLQNYRNQQSPQLSTLFPPTDQFVFSNQNQGIIEFSKQVKVHQFYVRPNKHIDDHSVSSVTVSLYNKDILLHQIKLEHKSKFNIWLLSEGFDSSITKIVIPPHTQIDSLMVTFPQSTLTSEFSMKRLISQLKLIYSEIKPTDQDYKLLFNEQGLKQTISQYKNNRKTLQDTDFSKKTLQQSVAGSKISGVAQELLLKDDIDVQAMNLLVNYVTRLHEMIENKKEVPNLQMSPKDIQGVVADFEMSLSESEKKTFKSTTDMFLGKMYTEEEIINMLSFLVDLGKIQQETEDQLGQQYNDN